MGKHWHEVIPKGHDIHVITPNNKMVRSYNSKNLSEPMAENRFDEEPNFSSPDSHRHISKNKHAKAITFLHGSSKSKEDVKKTADEHAKAIFRRRFGDDSGTHHAIPSIEGGTDIYHLSY